MDPHPSVADDRARARVAGDGGSRDPLDVVTKFDVLALERPCGVFRGTARDGVLRVNQHFLDVTGLRATAARGWDWLLAVHYEDRDRLRRAIGVACQSGAESAFPIRMQVRPGVIQTMRVSVIAVPTAADDWVFVGAIEVESIPTPEPGIEMSPVAGPSPADVDAGDPYEILVSAMPIPIAYAAPDGVIEFANEAWTAWTGTGVDASVFHALALNCHDGPVAAAAALAGDVAWDGAVEVAGRPIRISIAPLAEQLGGGHIVTLGELHPVDPLPGPTPSPSDGVSVIDAFVGLLDATSDYGALLAPDGGLLHLNASARGLLGLVATEAVEGRLLSEFVEYRDAVNDSFGEIVLDALADTGVVISHGELIVVNGSARPVSVMLFALNGAAGSSEALVCLVRDHTDLERERVRATEQLERRANLDRLIAALARSLVDATPMTIEVRVVGVLQVLAENFGAAAAAFGLRSVDRRHAVWPADADVLGEHTLELPDAGAFLFTDETSRATVGGWVVAGATVPLGVISLRWETPTDLTTAELEPLDLIGAALVAARDRVNAENSVHESNLRFRTLAEHSTDLVVVVGSDLQPQYLSPAATRFLGFSDTDRFDPASSVIHPDDRGAVQAQMEMIAAAPTGAHSTPVVARFRRQDGVYRWVELEVTNLLAAPVVGGLVINGRDITQSREVEERLRDSEGRFRGLVQNMAEGVTVLAADGSVKYSTPAAARMMGFDEGHATGRLGLDFVVDEDRERATQIVGKAFSQPGIQGPIALRVHAADGQIRVVEAMGHNRLDDPQVEGIVVTTRDITETVEAEGAARRSDARLRAVVENLSDVVTIVDAEGQIVYTSPAAATLFGYEEGDESWTDPTARIHPDDRANVMEKIGGHVVGESQKPVRFRLQAADGHWCSVEAVARDLTDDPDVAGIVVTTRDVSARTRAESLVADQAMLLTLIARGAPLSSTLSALCDVLERHVGDVICGFLLVDQESRTLQVGAGPRMPVDLAEACQNIPIGGTEDVFGSTAAQGSTAVVLDVDTDPRAEHLRDVAGRCEVGGIWSVPIFDSMAQRVLGTLAMFFHDPHEPSTAEREVVRMFSQTATIAIERQVAEDLLAHRANHDSLTGLPNRVLFLEFLSLAIARMGREHGGLAVLFIDLDRFKHINDGLGHDAGDDLLQELARRLQGVMRPTDVVARFGGDEFTVLCDGLDSGRADQHVAEIARRLLDVVEQPITIEGEDRRLSASLGIAIALPESTADGLLRDADAAMYEAKQRGKARWEIFDDNMRSSMTARLDLESRLERAIERDEFRLFLQPIIDLGTGRCVGAEALLRWQDPELGLVTPDAFIGLAEDTGLIIPIGEWALTHACRTVARWDEVGLLAPEFTMAVNLSARQVAQADLVDKVRAVLEQCGPMASRICLEITESVLMEESSGEAMRALRALGVRVSIDDFGTGFSSLGYLKRFPVDSVKVDRSFVDGLGTDGEDSAIVAAVVSLGHALDLSVVAEGVETSHQLRALLALGCDRAQGYWFSGPRDPTEFAGLLNQQPWIDGRSAWGRPLS